MRDVAIGPDGGPNPVFRVDDARDAPARFALGIRKSGSSIFANLVTALARENGWNVVDVPHAFFTSGLTMPDWNRADALGAVTQRGNVYTGFRDCPTAIIDTPVFREGAAILLVRDPRDALVSEYFSNAYSHSLPDADGPSIVSIERERALRASLEDYVLGRVAPLNATIERYLPLLERANVTVQRYEDVILAKRAWIGEIARVFGWRAEEGFVDLMLGWADVVPDAERPTEFVRRVVPGDHREKLSADVLAEVNRRLSPAWGAFGYWADRS